MKTYNELSQEEKNRVQVEYRKWKRYVKTFGIHSDPLEDTWLCLLDRNTEVEELEGVIEVLDTLKETCSRLGGNIRPDQATKQWLFETKAIGVQMRGIEMIKSVIDKYYAKY